MQDGRLGTLLMIKPFNVETQINLGLNLKDMYVFCHTVAQLNVKMTRSM